MVGVLLGYCYARVRVVDLGVDREREHFELGLAERLKDGHRDQHVAVEREAHLAAQRRTEVLDLQGTFRRLCMESATIFEKAAGSGTRPRGCMWL